MDGDDDEDQLLEGHGRDVTSKTVVVGKGVERGSTPRRNRKKGLSRQNAQLNNPTTSAAVDEGRVDAAQGETDDDDNIPDKPSNANKFHKGKGKSKGKKTVVRLDPIVRDETDNSGEGKKRRSSKHTSKVQDNETHLDDSHSSRKRTRGDTESKFEPRRSHRFVEKSVNEQIAQENVKQSTTTAASKHKDKAPGAKRGRKGKNEEYEVEKILNSRLDKKTGTAEYLVKWVGYPTSANTWEPVDNLTHCHKKLTQYRASQTTK